MTELNQELTTDQTAPNPTAIQNDAATETSPTPPPPTEPSKDDFSKRFTALSRKERDVLAQAEKIKADLEQVNNWKKEKDLFKTNPVKFMEENGWKFSDLVDFTLNNGKLTPEQQIAKLQEQLESIRSEKDKEQQTRAKAQEEANILAYKANQKTHLQSKKEEYELLNHYESFDLVYDIMNEHYQKTLKETGVGEELDIDKVASEVEKYLEGQLEKASSTKKFQSKFASTKVPVEAKSEGTQTKDAPKTLTNSDVTGSSSSSHPARWLDDDESKARAAKFLEDAWKKQKS
jgi:hypothetical protein